MVYGLRSDKPRGPRPSPSCRCSHSEKGSTIIFAMFVVAIMAIYINVMMTRVLTEQLAARTYLGKNAALFAAESAADHAIQNLRQDALPLWRPDGQTNDPDFWYALSTTQQFVVRRSEFLDNFTDPDLRQFTARGRSGDVQTSILVTLRRRRQALGTGYGGILGREHVHIMDGDLRRFDAYDSSSGPYTPSSRISADVLRTNSQHPEQLMMPQSGADVWGRLAVGPGLTDQGQIDQVVKNLPEIRWYEGGPEPYSPASGFSAPLVAFVPGDNCADGSLDLAGTQRVTLDSSHNGGRYYFCNADSGNAVSLSGTSELVATGGGAILVYVNGDLVVHDHASIDSEAGNTSLYFVVNRDLDLQTGGALGLRNSRNEEDPTKLRFYVAYQGHRVDLASPPDDPSTLRLYGLVYAPDRHVNVTGNGRVEVSGGLVGRSIQVHSSEFELHADLALERSAQTAPQGSETVIEILSWSAP